VFFDEFRKRRGYDLKKYLREFDTNDSTDLVARIKSDYRETMADLMLENFSQKFTAWAHSKNALSTNQAHGSPGNLLDLYAAVDIAETETFGSSFFPIPGLRRDSADVQNVDPDPIMMKFPSSAANAIGHKLVSCETFTWLTEHFKTSWAQCKPEVEKIFLSGINHVFYHGTTYSPAEAQWPGWLFYASVNMVPNNSLWPHLKGLNNYITRCQSVLQQGKPDNELMIYWPVYDNWHNSKGKDKPFRIHNIEDWLHGTSFYKNAESLQQKGFSFDFVSDKMISQTYVDNDGLHVTDTGAVYKTLIIPAANYISLSTLDKINSLAQNGATVIFQALPKDIPGLNNLQERRNSFNEILKNIR
ncbi:MAG: glycoside hydrolase, partial [Sphingobacteriales bacterium]